MRILPRIYLVVLIPLVGWVAPARGDAIVRTQAMLATTIAEYSVEPDAVELQLEIGLGDLPAFANLLPDDLHQRLGNPPAALSERLDTFFGENLTVSFDGGKPVPGRILEMEPRERIRRDEITGAPLPATDAASETIIYVRLAYPLPARPKSLTIGGTITSAAGIGFVLYHDAIAVNDFRYLSPAQTVNLDWDDPWYSRFEQRALRRAYFAPMSGFIYVEPYEVRKEIIVRPKDLQDWIDLGLAGRDTIPVDMQVDVKRAVAQFLRGRQPVEIDGRAVQPELAQVNFLERTLKTSRVIDPPIELDLDSAVLGIIFVYPTDGLPQRVTMTWDLFNDKIGQVPVSAVDQAGPFPGLLEPDFATLEWQNFLKNPVLPTMVALAPPPGTLARWSALLRWPALVLCVLISAWILRGAARRPDGSNRTATTSRRAQLTRRAGGLSLAVIVTVGCFWLGDRAVLSDERAGTAVAGLLQNIYRAFDYRDEEQIYDVLAQSVQGDLLTRVYLDTRKGLELANQGGARAKVKQIDLVDLSSEPGTAGGFVATAVWQVIGSVGHWGHVHQRRNQYQARLDVRPTDGAWKLTDLEILAEERLALDGSGSGAGNR